MKHKLFYLFLIVLLACSGEKDNDIAKVKLKELSNHSIDLSQYKGKTVFINFWATWCKPCIQEMPTIDSVQRVLHDKNLVFLLASNEEPEQIEKFAQRHSYDFHYVRLENMEELKIQGLPTTFIFNANGKLKFSDTGYRNWNEPINIQLITKIINDYEE